MGKRLGKIEKRTMIYSLSAVLVFLGLLAGTFFPEMRKPDAKEYSYIMLGDSILGQYRDETSIAALVSQEMQVAVLNGAMGGTAMGRIAEDERFANTESSLSMYALSKAIVTGEFGAQQTVRCRWSGAEYFEETVNQLEQADYGKADVLFIQHCINDYHRGVPICNAEDPYDVTTYEGALRSVVQAIQERYPDLRIILITPTYSWYLYHTQPETCEEYNSGYGVLEDYVNAQMRVARELDVEIIDLYHDLYPHNVWEDWQTYTLDGVHPNEAGRALIAQEICAYMETR